MKVSASFLSSLTDREISSEKLIKLYEENGVDYIHADIMDGKFVSRKTFTFSDVKKYTKNILTKLDVHLMVNNPIKYIKDFATLNVEYITFHYEAVKDINSVIELIKNYGIKVGISINPETDVEALYPYLNDIDLVLVMSVKPGESYQTFNHSCLEKIKKLRDLIDKNNYKTIINVDGGINEETSILVSEAGAHMVSTDSFLRKNIKNNINYLKKL